MYGREEYRKLQADLSANLRGKRNYDKAISEYCKKKKLIVENGFIFDDWNNTMALKIVDERPAWYSLDIVELPFPMEFMKQFGSVMSL